jgi:hypothetical protein
MPLLTMSACWQQGEVDKTAVCKVCMTFKVNTRLNCGHELCSTRCGRGISECPFCRMPTAERQM